MPHSLTLGIIPCTKAKIWDPMPMIGEVLAENAYTDPFHHLARTYVLQHTKYWFIFSAKYGLLHPNEFIPEIYDVTFDRPHDPYISVSDLKKQIEEKKLQRFKNIIAVCNSRYISFLKKAFDPNVSKVLTPFKKIEDNAEGCFILNQSLLKIIKEKTC